MVCSACSNAYKNPGVISLSGGLEEMPVDLSISRSRSSQDLITKPAGWQKGTGALDLASFGCTLTIQPK
jgi:hypothetical protein